MEIIEDNGNITHISTKTELRQYIHAEIIRIIHEETNLVVRGGVNE